MSHPMRTFRWLSTLAFSAHSTFHYAFIRILSSWHFSLCTNQDSQLAHLVVVESYPHSGRLHLSEMDHRGPLLTTWRADLPVTLREAREYGSVCLSKGTVGAGGLMRKFPFSSLGLSIQFFCDFQQYIFNLLTCSEYGACTYNASASW